MTTGTRGLQDHVAIVTGAGAGIGRAIATRFAAEGARVVVADVDGEAARRTRDELTSAGYQALGVPTDVRSAAEVGALVDHTVAQFGQVDILVSNAGVNKHTLLVDLDEAEWNWVLDVNLKGVFLCGQAAARQMVKAGRGGRIINMASTNAEIVPFPGLGAYSASKGAVHLLTKAMALELAPYRINVNAIGPGVTETDMTRAMLQDPERRRYFREHTPLGRPARPEDIAAVALFLASAPSAYMTGSIVFVDGGRLIL